MSANLFVVAVPNNAGNMLAGFSATGAPPWSHFETAIGTESPAPGFVQLEVLATRQSASLASFPGPQGNLVMAFLGHADNNIIFAASVDGTVWSQRTTGFTSIVPPAIFAMPYAPHLLLAFIEPQDNEIIIASSADNGVTWQPHRTGQSSKSAPAIAYTADAGGGALSPNNFYFLMLFQSNDSSNNLLACTSDDGITWQPAFPIGQQTPCAPALAIGIPGNNQTNITAAFLSNDASNRILLCGSSRGLTWGSAVDTGHHGRGAPQLLNIDGALYLLFLGLTDDNIYCCRSTDGVTWTETQVCPSLYAPAAAPFSGQPPGVLTPPVTVTRNGGLHSASNYYFYDGGRPLRNVSVEILVTEDIAIPAATSTGSGVSFPLNCYSPANNQPTAPQQQQHPPWKTLITGWQQFDTHVAPNTNLQTDLFFRIDIWPQQSFPGFPGATILNLTSANAPLPQASIPKNSRFVTTLQNDINDNVTGATFTAYDPTGKIIKTWTKQLVGQTTTQGPSLSEQEISPIIAFQVNFVSSNGQVTLTTGAGTITVSAWNLLTVEGSKPPGAAGPPTGEGANSTYGTLSNQPSTIFTQTFGVT